MICAYAHGEGRLNTRITMRKKEVSFVVYEYSSPKELSNKDRELVMAAREASDRAYSPYSGFSVGAAALLTNGEIITGNNQENVAYPSGLCAERVTLFYANSKFPNEAVVTLAITAKNKNGLVAQPVKPCGACRQVILETEERFGAPIKVILDGNDYLEVIENAAHLLPLSFNKDALDG